MPTKALTFSLPNAAIRFPRINADATTSALSASDFRTAIGAVGPVETMTLLADVHPGYTTSYTFASIPQTYKHLMLVGSWQRYGGAQWLTARVNAATSGFTSVWSYALAGGVLGSQAGPTDGFLLGSGNGTFSATIFNYRDTNSDRHSCISTQADSTLIGHCSSVGPVTGGAGLLDAITALTVYFAGDNMHADKTRFSLYGLP